MFGLSLLLVLPSIVLLRWVAQTNLPFKTWVLTKLQAGQGRADPQAAVRVGQPPSPGGRPRPRRRPPAPTLLRYAFIVGGTIAA